MIRNTFLISGWNQPFLNRRNSVINFAMILLYFLFQEIIKTNS